jgi:carbonic anhydrase
MSCELATAPIDINNNPSGTCDLKCKYNFKYKDTSSKLTNNVYFLSLTHDQFYPNPVTFNADSYQVSEIRIYSPSLHTYSGSKADGEIIIVHAGTQGNLLVCVPLVKGSASSSKSSLDLENIIYNSKKFTRKANQETPLQKAINLTNFVPSGKPFYSYKATLPYVPCNGEYNYVVFSKDDNAYVTISEIQLETLKSIISSHSMEIKTGTKFYVNSGGANTELAGGKNEEIYIDCQPVSEEGEVIGSTSKPKTSDSQDFFKKIDLSKIVNSNIFQIIIAIIVVYLVYYLFMYLVRNFGKNKTGGAAVVSTSNI